MLQKKACRSRHAFFYACLLILLHCLNHSAIANTPCTINPAQLSQFESVKVRSLKDGDSFILEDSREVRLIGVNTPEMFKKPDGLREPLAQEAKTALQKLLNEPFFIQLGQQAQDKYGRTLAYAYDQNGLSIEYQLLQQGLGFLVAYPPNLKQLDCLQAAQQKAKQLQLGVWNEKYYQAISSQHISSKNTGFTRIKGKLLNIQYSKNAWWLQLEGNVVLKINKPDTSYFKSKRLNALKHQTIIVNGWMIDRSTSVKNTQFSPFVLLLKHPSQLEMHTQK